MKRIGIFGSSFNPIHLGHLIIADQSIQRLNLEKVLFVPTKSPYHKNSEILPYEVRYKMACIEADKHDKIEVSDVEKSIEGNSYTYDVIKLIENDYPNTRFYFIMGSDSLVNFHTWYKYEKLIDKMGFVIFKRPEDEDISELIRRYRDLGMEIYYYEDIQIQISSTFIRNSIRDEKSVRYLLSDKIIDYIESNGYYGI
ncbi:MAG: nicotinate (nicotinamide) nucleotide adenylyltransferase [Tissierellia bacterium]|nr:nicotinate (nicotinamide) nucleotide adenylyltransferase [Tissierellia bacterium]